jgi:hypothetical protein
LNDIVSDCLKRRWPIGDAIGDLLRKIARIVRCDRPCVPGDLPKAVVLVDVAMQQLTALLEDELPPRRPAPPATRSQCACGRFDPRSPPRGRGPSVPAEPFTGGGGSEVGS